jgi:glycosyltransferase involved in cell wall biosynthesis
MRNFMSLPSFQEQCTPFPGVTRLRQGASVDWVGCRTVPPRVAFFTDSFHEVNGVALTSRMLEEYAARQGYPFFSVHTGPVTRAWRLGSIQRFELALGPLPVSLDSDLRFDTFFLRHWKRLLRALREFSPDVVHLTGPSHMGILAASAARELHVPLVASWHTNVHEFGARRLQHTLRWLPASWAAGAATCFERFALASTLRFYRMARVTLATNPELCQLLECRTRRPCFLMRRGVDTELFRPERRRRDERDAGVVLGYVGRLSPEKNIRLLARVEQALQEAGCESYRFLIVGQGGESEWLRANLRRAELVGVKTGEALAEAYASMDLFVFPSETDTYGNVVQEAHACGVPALVTSRGGPRFLVAHGEDGLVARDAEEFCRAAVELVRDGARRRAMGAAGRRRALTRSWDQVFAEVYRAYEAALGR